MLHAPPSRTAWRLRLWHSEKAGRARAAGSGSLSAAPLGTPTHLLPAGARRPPSKQTGIRMSDQLTGNGQANLPPSPYQIQVSYGASQSPSSSGIARGTGADWFGPLDPLTPIAPPDIAGRRFDFPPGYNLVTRPRGYEPVGFAELRAFADAYDLLRLVIETRKDQMERQRWRIRPRAPSQPASAGDSAGASAPTRRRAHRRAREFLPKAGRRHALEDLAARAARGHVRHRRGDAVLPAHALGPALRAAAARRLDHQAGDRRLGPHAAASRAAATARWSFRRPISRCSKACPRSIIRRATSSTGRATCAPTASMAIRRCSRC